MIVPARTFVPVVTFTPRRWEAESRPLREEAAPFFFDILLSLCLLRWPLLCGRLLGRCLLGRRCLLRAPRLLRRSLFCRWRFLGGIPRRLLRRRGSAGAARRDRGDLDQRVPLPVPPAAPVVRLRLVGEARDLRAAGVAHHPGAHPRRLELLRGGQHSIAVD